MKNLNKNTIIIISFLIWLIPTLFSLKMILVWLLIAIVFYFVVINYQKEIINKNNTLLKENNKKEAQFLAEQIKKEKKLEPINTNLFLESNERAFLKENSTLMEARAVRKSTGSRLGFRVMKGVYVGGYQGQSESNQEIRLIENGDLILTSKKLIFRGNKENRMIPLSKIIEIKRHVDAIEIATLGRQKTSLFTVSNPYIWNIILTVLNTVDNPLDFNDIKNIDIDVV